MTIKQPETATAKPEAQKKTEAKCRPTMSVATRSGPPEMVTLEVGPERKKYILHKSFLTYYSDYFTIALDGNWKESTERIIPLDDVEPAVMNVFVNWLYTQKLPAWSEWLQVAEVEERQYGDDDIRLLMVKAIAFGDRFMVSKFRQEVNNLFVDSQYMVPPNYAIVIYAFENFPPCSTILGFLVDCQCRNWDVKLDVGERLQLQSQLPKEFLLQFMKRQKDAKDAAMGPCTYHEHADDAEKARCMQTYENSRLRNFPKEILENLSRDPNNESSSDSDIGLNNAENDSSSDSDSDSTSDSDSDSSSDG